MASFLAFRRAAPSLARDVRAGLVLMYHRVGQVASDPWGLCVSAARFERDMARVASCAVGLEDVFSRPRFVLVTLDDGYVDTLSCALPVLEKHGVPAVVFVPSGPGERFWWEDVEDPSVYRERKLSGRAVAGAGPRSRLSSAELELLRASPWIEIGGHTVTHPYLPALPVEEQVAEMASGARAFAYPFGAVGAARPSCQYAFTTVPDLWWSGTDPLLIPRVMVREETDLEPWLAM